MVGSSRCGTEPFIVTLRAPARTSRRAVVGFGFMLTLVLSGCVTGNDSSSEHAAQTAEAGASQSSDENDALTGLPVIGAVIWSTAIQPGTNEPIAPVATFPDTARVLYAVFPVERYPESSTIRAEWSYNGTSLEGLEQEVTATEDRVTGWLEFHLERSNQDRWPDGEYAISLTANNTLIAAVEVRVVESTSG